MKTILYTLVGLAVIAAVCLIVVFFAENNQAIVKYGFIACIFYLLLRFSYIIGKGILTSINKNNKQR